MPFSSPLRPLYRVYHLGRTGGIVRADIIEALDDEDAIERIRYYADDHAIELWDRGRFVAKVEPPQNAVVPEPVVTRAVDAVGIAPVTEAPSVSGKAAH